MKKLISKILGFLLLTSIPALAGVHVQEGDSPVFGSVTASSMTVTGNGIKLPDGSILTSATSLGTISGVTAGAGLSGGGTSGVVILNVGSVSLSTQVINNLPVTNLNGGTGATSSTFWRGDGSWATPPGSGGGGGSILAITTGTNSGYTNVISSPTALMILNGVQFLVSELPSTTAYMSLNPSTVTLQGNTFNGVNELVLLNSSGNLPALNGANLTSLTGANVTGNISGNAAGISGNINASQINAGSLGAGVIVSSIAVGAVYPGAVAAGTYSNMVISGANVSGNIPANAANITGNLPASQVASGSLGSGVIVSSLAVNAVYPAAVAAGTYSNITLPGANVNSGVPAANIASGSLGASVIASSITLAAMYGSPTLNAANITNIQGAQVGSGVPAANIASGSLGASVIASSHAVNSVVPTNLASGSYTNITGVGTLTAGTWSATRLLSSEIPTDVAYADTAQNWTAVQTHTSSVTINAPLGMNALYNITAGSMTVNNLTVSSVVQTDASHNLTTGQVNLASQVTGSLPAASIATGSLGASVIASSLAVNSVVPSNVSAGTYSNITGVGTIGTGVWNGTALTSTYIPADVTYTDTNQNISGIKTFTSSVTVTAANGLSVTNTVTGGALVLNQNSVSPISYPTSPTIEDGNTNGYLQHVIQNFSAGNNASGDLVITSNLGGDTSNYIDIGINSSGFNQTSQTVEPSTWGYLTTSDHGLAIFSGINGTDTSADLVLGSSTPITANGFFRMHPNGSINIISSETIAGAGGLGVTYNVTAGSATITNLSASLPVQTDASKNLTSAAINLAGSQVTGSLPAASIASGSLGGSVIASSIAVNAVVPTNVSAGSYTNITGVGTLTAGIWNGTALTSTYLPTDVEYTDVNQTISGVKTFSSSMTVNGTIQAQLIVATGTVANQPGEWNATEGSSNTAVGVQANNDVLWADNGLHTFAFNPNNTSTYTVVGTSFTQTAGDIMVAGSYPGSVMDATVSGSTAAVSYFNNTTGMTYPDGNFLQTAPVYTQEIGFSSFTPVASTNYYFGIDISTPPSLTQGTTRRVFASKVSSLVTVDFDFICNTTASVGGSTITVRSGTSSVDISTITANLSSQISLNTLLGSVSGVSISLPLATNPITFVWKTPAWATAPTGCYMNGIATYR